MYSINQLQAFLKAANIVTVSKETGISRPTLIAIKSGDHNVQYKTVVKLNDYIEGIFEDEPEA